MRRTIPFLAVVALGIASPAAAQDAFTTAMEKALTDERVSEEIGRALRQVDQLKCGEKPCAATNDVELAAPPITHDQARAAMRKGVMSAILDWCGLDWQARVLSPMMMQAKARQKLDDRQVGLLVLLHGSQHIPVKEALVGGGPCPETKKRDLERPVFGDPMKIGIGPNDPIPGVEDRPGRDGLTPDTAVVVAPGIGPAAVIRTEIIWIGRRHPEGRKAGAEAVGQGDRRLERIDVEVADGAIKAYYFDVTDAVGDAQ